MSTITAADLQQTQMNDVKATPQGGGGDVRNLETPGKAIQATDTVNMKNGSMTVGETLEVVDSLESYMNALQTNIGFSVDRDSEKVVVKITNRETDEVIRQIPPEELLALQEKMKELTGIIFSETV